MALEMENLQQKNDDMRQRSTENAALSQVGRNEVELQNTGITDPEKEEKQKMHQDLRHLMDKYEEKAKKIGMSSSVDTLLNDNDLTYNTEIMAVPLPPKFKVPQMELYDRYKDPV